jgi:hypothetical protein
MWELFILSIICTNLIDETVTHIRNYVYTPTSLVYITDMHHGLNLTGIDNMRKIEYSNKQASKLLWLSSQVKRIQWHAEIDMQEVIIYPTAIKEIHQETDMDGVSFDMRALFEYLLTSFGLSEEACHRNVEIHVTVGGANLDANLGHVTIGFKICDKSATDPVTGKYIYKNVEGLKDDNQLDNLKSDAWCFHIVLILEKDNKGTYEKYLHPIFEYYK